MRGKGNLHGHTSKRPNQLGRKTGKSVDLARIALMPKIHTKRKIPATADADELYVLVAAPWVASPLVPWPPVPAP